MGYLEKSKGYRFYFSDRYTKFVQMRHTTFLEEEMIWGSVVVWKIDVEDKRVYVPNPMIQEPFFSLPAIAAPLVQDTVMQAPEVVPIKAISDENVEPALRDPIDNIVIDLGEPQQPQIENVLDVEDDYT